jgi:hypothetical protein
LENILLSQSVTEAERPELSWIWLLLLQWGLLGSIYIDDLIFDWPKLGGVTSSNCPSSSISESLLSIWLLRGGSVKLLLGR